MKKQTITALAVFAFLAIVPAGLAAQDAFSGHYDMENQASYDNEKKWVEIGRNKMQEIVVRTGIIGDCVAYYDADGRELFFVHEPAAQYNTLMKVKILGNDEIELYRLEDRHWQKVPERYHKTKPAAR
jgi:hypothetical protein